MNRKYSSVYFGILIFVFCYGHNNSCYADGVMKLRSPSFEHNKIIPARFTCQGEGVNPALEIDGIPVGAKSLVLIMDDPDAPSGTFLHWLVYDIPVTVNIAENSVPGKQGVNTARGMDYVGPCPPSGTHRYIFKLFALDKELGLKGGRDLKTVEKAMAGHILGKAELIGLYRKK